MKLAAAFFAALVLDAGLTLASDVAWPYEAGIFYESYRAECLVKGAGNTKLAKDCVSAAGGCCTMAEFLKHIDQNRAGMTDPILGRDPTPAEVRSQMVLSGESKGKYDVAKLFDGSRPDDEVNHKSRLLYAMSLLRAAVLYLESRGLGAQVENSIKNAHLYRQASVDTRIYELRTSRETFARNLLQDTVPHIRRLQNSFSLTTYDDVDFDKIIRGEERKRNSRLLGTVNAFLQGTAGTRMARSHQRIVHMLEGAGKRALDRPAPEPGNPPAAGRCRT
ncbi:hypothetical protein NQ176_g3094 [Zarea fungicola]|uniref:Uncharacterized protein n=1 Tax=Zarea fungicola TaxID=93591 RepID=A0ACC1NLA4_9HYPO|nr:hypothetical protein NQ176_g3094 [Lecanicillium fungicola]